MKGVHDVQFGRKTTKFYLMCNGLSSDEIENMDNEEVVLLCNFMEHYEEEKMKKLAYEIAKTMWGGK